LFLKLEIIKKLLAVPTIVLGVFYGIKIMIAGMMVNTLIAYYLNSYWSGRYIGYTVKEQIRDIFPSFGLALGMGVGVYLLGQILPFKPLWLLTTQVLTGAAFIFLFCELTKFRDYIFVKELIVEKIREIRKK
ncbi:MAG: lipopolysaccharide biosynthesis protein, partial [Bacteroidales bacterium]|nr:lipopolysaccharide biosynthesis protein [Bacteroidales bacterium]